MLSAGQSAGNIFQPNTHFVYAKRKRKRISMFAETAEVKLWDKDEQLPYWPNEVSSCLSGPENEGWLKFTLDCFSP